MGENFNSIEQPAEGNAKQSSSVDWHHLWKGVKDEGTKAGAYLKEKLSQVDTNEIGDKAKHAANEGLKVARGRSDNQEANKISDAATRFIPGAGLLRKGADIAHETGADGKFLEGKKGPLHAPSQKSMQEAGREAINSMIPLPGNDILTKEVLRRTMVKDVGEGAANALTQKRSDKNASDQNNELTEKKIQALLPKITLHTKH